MTAFPWRMVTIDIDGTLTTVHGWGVFARRVGKEPLFQESNRRLTAREITEDEHLRTLLGFAVGLRRTDVEEILEGVPKIGGIGEAIAELHERGALVALLSHNPIYVSDWYRSRFGFDDAEGALGTELNDGRVPPPPRSTHADKMGGLRRLLARHSVSPRAVVHIGDGRPDAVLFPHVGGGVALNSSLPEVEQAADLAVHLTDLRPLIPRLAGMVPRGVGPMNGVGSLGSGFL